MKVEELRLFGIYRWDVHGSPYVCEARYDTVAEVLAHPFQPDGEYKIGVGARYFAWNEFEAWAADQERQKERPVADVKDAIRKYIRKRHPRG